MDDWNDIPTVASVSRTDTNAEIARLAALPLMDYDKERKDAAAQLGVRATVLDAEVVKARGDGESDRPNMVEALEAWPHPVDGAKLAEEVRELLRAHVVFANDQDADVTTLWVFGSYLMATWRLWPRLLVTSPTKACGKSTLLEVIDALAHCGLLASNASPAAIFRAIEHWKPTLILDEADTWMRQNEELAGILNSGHTRASASVLRVQEVKGEHVPMRFSTWCPMAIAGIGSQRDTLMSRSVIIGLRRKLETETVQRMPIDLRGQMERVRRQLIRWTGDNAIRVGALEIEPPTCGNDRAQDNYTPLWRIAETLGGLWPERIASAYMLQAQGLGDDADEPAGVMMLRDIAELFAASKADRLPATEIMSDLTMLEERPWNEWRHGKPITARTMAKLMKPFGVKVRVLRIGGHNTRAYLRSEVEAAAQRYTHEKCSGVALQQNQPLSGNIKCSSQPSATPDFSGNPLKTKECYTATHKSPTEDWKDAQDDIHNPDNWQ